MTTHNLFPPLEPYATGHLAVTPPHEIYWEQCGNPEGQPVLFLHGGPGTGCGPMHRRFFDPAHYRICLFDQRGSGRSTPLGEVKHNTTAHLIADIEKLREMWGIEKWHVFGGSWGSTLALAYAQAHPDRVSALVLRGIFLMLDWEIDWFLTKIGRIWPEVERDLLGHLPESERGDVLGNYYKRLMSDDPEIHLPAARAWSRYEQSAVALIPNPQAIAQSDEDVFALGISRMETHYFLHNQFTPKDALLRNVDKIRHIPAVIVQGRYDLVCPLHSAEALSRAWPEAQYVVIPDAGHSVMEPGIMSALLAATEKFKAIS